MTKEQIRAHIERHIDECFDSFVFVGQVAGRSEIIIATEAGSADAHRRVQAGLINVVNSDIFTVPLKVGKVSDGAV